MQCDAMQCNAMRCTAMQCNAMQCNAIRIYIYIYSKCWQSVLHLHRYLMAQKCCCASHFRSKSQNARKSTECEWEQAQSAKPWAKMPTEICIPIYIVRAPGICHCAPKCTWSPLRWAPCRCGKGIPKAVNEGTSPRRRSFPANNIVPTGKHSVRIGKC